MTLTVGSLFSGIGGLDLGLERAGGTVRWQSEIDPHCCRVLAKHWPHVPNLGDIKTIDWKAVPSVDLICGGYPCQPFSLAGVRRGESDPRHLWPWMRDAIRVVRPRFALLENVPGHLGLGFDAVLRDLAELGYDTEWDCIPAAAVGAPHLRYRVFVVAHDPNTTSGRTPTDEQRRRLCRLEQVGYVAAHADSESQPSEPVDAVARSGLVVPDANTGGRDGRTGIVGEGRRGQLADGDWWAAEPDVGRVAHGVSHRMDRLRALGNAVVPQVAEWIGRRIIEVAA